ncbi:uncharacterized protein LOC123313060 [Coccinella septempunctata]|uniref:uncharacterized protein LOC123313060 n=1 Tax=Coccinella septempunctata TaxID=41139 RepID=UPI001D093E76|nr:uncharacterized protein LOC123313060 [Coccinella septempunctata]
MRFLILSVLLLGVYQEVSAQYSPVELLRALNEIRVISVISNKIGTSCKNKDDFKQKTEDMLQCYMSFKGKETVCGTVKNSLENCTQPLVTSFESCVDPKYHDIPKFIVEIAKSAADYACKTKGEKLIELLHPCVTKLTFKKSDVCLKSFKQKIENIENDKDITNVKTDLCKSLETTKACILKDFKNVCHNDFTLDAVVGVYDAIITKPCKHI